MKKLITSAFLIIIYFKGYCQFFSAVSATNKGLAVEMGTITNTKYVAAVDYKFSPTNLETGSTISIRAGKLFTAGGNDENHWRITPSAGIAYNRFVSTVAAGNINKDYGQVFTHESIQKEQSINMLYRFEVAAHWDWQEVFVYTVKNKTICYGIGWKWVLNKKGYE